MLSGLGVFASFTVASAATPGLIAFADADSRGIPAASRYVVGPSSPPTAGHGYAIASMDDQGSVVSTTDAFAYSEDAMMPGCNAGVDIANGHYIKTTSRVITFVPASASDHPVCATCKAGSFCCVDPRTPDESGTCFTKSCDSVPVDGGVGGDILTVDLSTGHVKHNSSMSGDVAHPPFGAFNPADGLMYSVVPYSYTEAGIFSFDPVIGEVKKRSSFAKEQLDGIGLCEGTVWSEGKDLIFQMSSGNKDYLTVVDLQSGAVVNRVEGFYGPFRQDPLNPDRLLAIQNVHKHGVRLLSVDPLKNITETIFAMESTTLGKDLRAQDQASLAVDPSGRHVWFAASYNVPSGDLYRGVFALELKSDRSNATLLSEHEAFSDHGGYWFGRLDYLVAPSTTVV